MARYKANTYTLNKRRQNKTTSTRLQIIHPDDVVVRSTYALYTEILNRERNEIDNAVCTLQRIRAASSK